MKLLVKTVASTAVVLVALAGCASRSSGGGTSAAGAGSDASSSTSPGGSTSTQNGSQPGASSSAPGGSPSTGATSGGQQPGSWSGSSSSGPGATPDPNAQVKYVSPTGVSLDKDGITLVTEVSWGGCNDQPQLVVMSQDASKVVVELKQTSHQRLGAMCPDIAREGAAKVKLAEPLGSRQVIDGIRNLPLTVH